MKKGKTIYQPQGKAGEYAKWTVSFYKGCRGDCSYCFLKKPPLSQNWHNPPILKKSLINRETAIKIFESEMLSNLTELQQNGLFFHFTSDPFLPETMLLTFEALNLCNFHKIPCIFLTKQTGWLDNSWMIQEIRRGKNNIVGFTLTGHDELEPGCSTNEQRILAMLTLRFRYRIKIWASIEPIIDFDSSFKMIIQSIKNCSHYKIGLLSGKKYNTRELKHFYNQVINLQVMQKVPPTIYWKESFIKQLNIQLTKENNFTDHIIWR